MYGMSRKLFCDHYCRSLDSLDLNPDLIKQQISALCKAESSYFEIQERIISSFMNIEEEQSLLDQYQAEFEEVEVSLQNLLHIHAAHPSAFVFEQQVATLKETMTEEDSGSYTEILSQANSDLKSIQEMAGSHATIHDDRLHTMVYDLQVELVKLRVVDSRARSTTPVSPVGIHIRIQKYKLPKLSIPEFDGNPLHWATLWQRFSSAVDSNNQLDEHDKLT